MKGITLQRLLIVYLLGQAITPMAQINASYLDSIPFDKPKRSKLHYTFNDPQLTSIKIKKTKYKAGKYAPGAALKDMGADMMANMIGHVFEISTSRDVTWEMKTILLSDEKKLNWEVTILCPGEVYKEKEHQHDPSTGEESVVTVKYRKIFWEKGAVGLIKENDQIISNYKIIVDPAKDTLIYNTYYDVFQDNPRQIKTHSSHVYYRRSLQAHYREYAVTGQFRGEKFALIANGVSHTMWFFVNDVLTCVFYADLDFMPIRKEDRVMPYLLIDPDVSDEKLADWYRLAMFSRLLHAEFNH